MNKINILVKLTIGYVKKYKRKGHNTPLKDALAYEFNGGIPSDFSDNDVYLFLKELLCVYKNQSSDL